MTYSNSHSLMRLPGSRSMGIVVAKSDNWAEVTQVYTATPVGVDD